MAVGDGRRVLHQAQLFRRLLVLLGAECADVTVFMVGWVYKRLKDMGSCIWYRGVPQRCMDAWDPLLL